MSKDYHNQGQSDGAQNSYNAPDKGVFDFLLTGYSEEELQNISDYDKGWDNGYKNSK